MGNSGQRSEQSRTVRNNNQHSQHGTAIAIVAKAVFLVQLRFGFSEREDDKTKGINPSAVRTQRQSRVIIRAVSTYVLVLASVGICARAHAQGMATGGTAVPAKPLPPGMKPPVVQYQDIAAWAGLTGVSISGTERGKQFIVEATGTGVAILDFDNDGLPDIFLLNARTLYISACEAPR